MSNIALISYWIMFTRTIKNPDIVPLPGFIRAKNGGSECDMAAGPCSCGAWHHFGEER